MKLSDYVVDFVAKLGVKHVFMLPGGGAMHLNDSLGKHPKLDYVCSLHEQAAAIAADAYSEYTNNVGVVMVTTGPGGTNALTGITASWLDSIPILVLSGQVKKADLRIKHKVRQMGFQEVPITEMVKPITKYAVTVTKPEEIRYHLEKAIFLARNGRPGPVWIDIPLDIQAAEISPAKLKGYQPEKKIKNKSLEISVKKLINLLNNSKRPAILVGNGVRLSKAEKEFLKLINILKIPVMTTWKSIDLIDENHPLFVGRPGAIGQRGANFVQQTCDLLLIIGARLDLGQTAYNHQNFSPHAKKVMIDIDEAEIKKMNTVITLPIISDAKDFITTFLDHHRYLKNTVRDSWLKICKGWQKKYPVTLPEYWSQKKYVNDYVLIDELSSMMTNRDLFIPGSSGACSERSMQAFKVKKGMRVFNSEALGSMGFALPMAIGGCLASGKKRTISIEGDGGFIMNIHELELLKRYNLPIKFFILNNNGYVSIQTTQKNHFESRFVASHPESGLTLPDYKKIAKAFGLPTVQIKNQKELKAKLKAILETPGPVICEVLVSSEQVTMPRVFSKKLENGKMVSTPMEDLWPYLDRDEFNQNMSVMNE